MFISYTGVQYIMSLMFLFHIGIQETTCNNPQSFTTAGIPMWSRYLIFQSYSVHCGARVAWGKNGNLFSSNIWYSVSYKCKAL